MRVKSITALSVIKDFFQTTASTPQDFCDWMDNNDNTSMPCLQERYMDKYTFRTSMRSYLQEEKDWVFHKILFIPDLAKGRSINYVWSKLKDMDRLARRKFVTKVYVRAITIQKS